MSVCINMYQILVPTYGENCISDEECTSVMGSYATCYDPGYGDQNGVCSCSDGYIHVDGMCKEKGTYSLNIAAL